MRKLTINIRLIVNSSVAKSEEPENLKKIPSKSQKIYKRNTFSGLKSL